MNIRNTFCEIDDFVLAYEKWACHHRSHPRFETTKATDLAVPVR